MQQMWPSRVRWRLRGAWMWPVFAALTIAEGFLLHERPIAGDDTRVVSGMLEAGFTNLLAVAVGAPLLGRLVRRVRRDLPRVVAKDYAGTALLLAIAAGLAIAGTVHRSDVLEERRDFSAQSVAVRAYVAARAPARFRARVNRADTLKLESDLYRTCVPDRDPRRALCLYVRTDLSPARIRRDPSTQPNREFAVPGAFRP